MNLLIICSLSLVNRSSSSLRKRNASDTSRRSAKQNPHSEAPAILVRRLNEAASAICHWRLSWRGCYKSNIADFTKTILTVLMQLSPPFSKLVTWTGLIKCSEKRAEFEMSSSVGEETPEQRSERSSLKRLRHSLWAENRFHSPISRS